jgi:hypothetical protein
MGLGCSHLIHRRVTHNKKYGLWPCLSKGTLILRYLCLSVNDEVKECDNVGDKVAVAFDSSGIGRINFSDFKNLMCR